MGHIDLKVYPNGRVVRTERVGPGREREELAAFGFHLLPALAALDTAARIWSDLRRRPPPNEDEL
ncbi:MAG: hypothetical protein E6J42_11990 [Chloroflexi bacterium]|nr:MAG: hypothetical protein E6J42_11990 [Chloroflexota bacterium]